VRILSWNLGAGNPGGLPETNIKSITAAIRSLDPDIVCFQEIAVGAHDGASSFHRIRDSLALDGRMGVSSRERALATAVLWKPGAAELREQTTHYADLCYHGLTLLSLNVTGLDRPLAVASVHLHPHSPEARLAEAAVLHMKADKGQLTAVLGDFNNLGAHDPEPDWSATRAGNRASRCLPHAPGERPFGDRRLAWRMAMAGYVDAAAGDPAPAATASHIRVDWALLSTALAPALTGYRVGDDAATGTKPETSDHRPLWVDIDPDRLSAKV
jgi:endonuclease/exonuclease/phosphatase family metal-dependent hydrolase